MHLAFLIAEDSSHISHNCMNSSTVKRFKFSASGRRSKIERQIRYPLSDWNLSKMKKSEGGVFPLYDLYAVSHHHGTVSGGHYTAQAKNRFDREWYDFNDSRCRIVDKEKEMLGCGSSAYCLFYNRVDRHAQERTKTIRRQSASRPELWPHLQRDTVTQWKSTRVALDYAVED